MLKKIVLILFVGGLLSGCRILSASGQSTEAITPASALPGSANILPTPESSTPNDPTPDVLPRTPMVIAPTPGDDISSSTPPSVNITAVKGNLFIRRGPDLAYNPIAILLEGQSAQVLAHDVLGNWVEIPIPTFPGKTGWISIQTVFSSVSGDLTDVPEVLPTDWPVASYLRNCTFHQMIVEPGDTTLSSVNNFPDNETWIYPGIHKVYDTDIDGQPEVLTVDLREGMRVDVRVDGNGDRRKCP